LALFGGFFDNPDIDRQIATLEQSTNAPDFWKNQRSAQAVIDQINALKLPKQAVVELTAVESDLETLFELLALEEDPGMELELDQKLKRYTQQVHQLDIQLLLGGKYDNHPVLFSINAGAGGTDAQDWAQMLLRMYVRFFENKGWSVETLELSPGEEAGIKGATLSVKGPFAYGFLKSEKGVHRLVRISPFNANDKRQTSFAAVEVIPEIEKDLTVQIRPEDLKVDTFRASGAGGQHINKTDSAVRMTHLPTGIVVSCQTQRSQIQNRETAMTMLASKLVQLMEEQHAAQVSELKGVETQNAWGHQIRSYVFHPYSMVKDHRSEYETSNVQGVMDGDLDAFIDAYLRMKKD
jgi:peptide chain release factor 2